MTVIALIGVVVPFIVGAFAVYAQAWIVLAVAAAILVINAVLASRRVHHYNCVACDHDARDHVLGLTAKVKYCTPRCGCEITDDSPLRRVTLFEHVLDLLGRLPDPGPG